MAFAEDLTVFFDQAGFGVAATPAAGADITVIFDNAYLSQLGVATSGPACLAMDSDVAALGLVQESQLTIGGVVYTIANLEPDSTGTTLVQLRKA